MDRVTLINRIREQLHRNSIIDTNNDLLLDAMDHITELHDSYEKGLEDAWELVKKIYLDSEISLHSTELKEIFECDNHYLGNILRNNTARMALDKVNAYEKKKAEEEARKIRIGDVVTVEPCSKPLGVVIAIDEKFKKAKLVYDDLSWRTSEWYLADLVKTGKHVDLEKLFEGIKGE